MKKKIGYLVPEFPSQTHIFLWREYTALKELGFEVDLVSTRRPLLILMSHSWAQEAAAQTSYLFPLSFADYLVAFFQLLKAGPKAWFESLIIILKAEDVTPVGRIYLLVMALVSMKLVSLSREKGWSHIHVPSCGNSANLAMFASILGGVSYDLSLLGPRLETYGPNQKNKWKYASFGLFQSMQLLNDAQQKLAGFLPKKFAFAPVGVNIEVMKRQSPYLPWPGKGSCQLYSCGRLNRVKGHEYVLKAVQILRQRGIDVHLQIAGEDEQGGIGYRQVIEQLIRDQSLSEYVELLGAVSEERNRQGYSDAHVYVMGSLDEAAGAVAAMEAMAMEVPVVMTNVGATSELIDTGVDGILVAPQKPEELANAIETILHHPELAETLSKNGRKKITTKFHHRYSSGVIAGFLDEIVFNESPKYVNNTKQLALEKEAALRR